jgi:hypothetical protein
MLIFVCLIVQQCYDANADWTFYDNSQDLRSFMAFGG